MDPSNKPHRVKRVFGATKDVTQKLAALSVRPRSVGKWLHSRKEVEIDVVEDPQTEIKDGILVYKPLDADRQEIRLITLREGQFEDEIYCTLSVVSFKDDELTYEALSYTWGDIKSNAEIILDGERVLVTKNLVAALRHLRYGDRPRVFWVDALSINQRDLAERQSQVMLMAPIYRRAWEVAAWLGEEMDYSGLAFDLFEEMADIDIGVHWDAETSPMLKAVGADRTYIDAVHSLFNRSWWDRVWTVQESVLPRGVQLYCGMHKISLNTLYNFGDSYMAHVASCCRHLVVKRRHIWNLEDGMALLQKLQYTRESCRDSTLEVDYPIREYRNRHCMDPRDKVYGMLGLANGEGTAIVPDYTISVAQVYENLALKLIKESASLYIFNELRPKFMKPTGAREIKLPSWVPDWTSEADKVQFRDLGSRSDDNWHFDASAESFATVKLIKQGKLSLRGVFIGSLAAVGRPQDAPLWFSMELFRTWAGLAEVFKDPDRKYPGTTDSFLLAFLKTLGGTFVPCRSDLTLTERTGDDTFDMTLAEDWWKWYEIGQDEEEVALVTSRYTTPEILGYANVVRIFTTMRRFFVSKDEGLIGLAPMEAKIGDRIAIFEGGKVPYILRQKPGLRKEYEIIGDSYVHGVMDGERWNGENLTEIILV